MAGGGGNKGGLKLPSNGCLRYAVLYVIALVLLITGVIATSGGLLSRLGLPSTGGDTSEITINSAAPAANGAAEQENNGATGNLPPNSGGSAPASSGQDSATISELNITGAPVASNQAGMITPYLSPAFYIVQAGDTLDAIGLAYDTTAADLTSYNRLPNNDIFPGQVLYLPPGSYQPVPNTGRNAGAGDQP